MVFTFFRRVLHFLKRVLSIQMFLLLFYFFGFRWVLSQLLLLLIGQDLHGKLANYFWPPCRQLLGGQLLIGRLLGEVFLDAFWMFFFGISLICLLFFNVKVAFAVFLFVCFDFFDGFFHHFIP